MACCLNFTSYFVRPFPLFHIPSFYSPSSLSFSPTKHYPSPRASARAPTQPRDARHNSASPFKARWRVRRLFEEARALIVEGELEKARANLLECLRLDVQDSHSWLALARLEQKRDSYTSEGYISSRAVFEKGLIKCPNNVHLLQAWAVLECRAGNTDIARSLFKKGLEVQPENAYVCQAWGILEQRSGNTQAARALFRKSAKQRLSPEILSAWAILEAGDGNVEEARLLFKRALEACRCIEHKAAEYVLRSWANMEERAGDVSRARELLSKALGAHPRSSKVHIGLAKLESRRGFAKRAVELLRAASNLESRPPPDLFNCWAQIEMTVLHNLEGGRRLLLKGISLHPREASLLQTLGMLEERAGNMEMAKKRFAESVDVRPNAAAFVAWGVLMEKEKDAESAMHLFEKALEYDVLHGPAYNAYGMMLARIGRMNKAREVFERGLAVHASSSVYHGYGELELKYGEDPSKARELFRKGASQTREDTSFVWHSWGMLELGERDPLAARSVFNQAVRRYPRNSRILVGHALALAFADVGILSDDGGARLSFKRAVAADPTHAHAWQAWGVFERRRGKLDSARALFKRGLRLCPTHGALWQAWGMLEMSTGNFAMARRIYTRGAAVCGGHVHLLQAWACMEVRCENVVKAKQLLDQALATESSHGPVWNAYGILEAKFGTMSKARHYFTSGLQKAPHHAPLYRAFGQAEERAGNYSRARSLFEQGLKCDPRHAPLYHAYSELEAKLGNLDGLARLKRAAEKYFRSRRKADFALRQGHGRGVVSIDSSDDVLDSIYELKSTPMELAINNNEDAPI
eukprot:Plantae.Rhodophyta-Hildenbrandia_rubra.ctg7224.p1 GENE.Plantae.Rhodophyta-Hildenbrandia_rubra.ctg7224~~Plantae.Rhodophyta-Hildenbrandia_rubra.ctg7224.p1  ORF type:complete len:811 (+),score=138.13 Plantae.Rhodophyta-Hildenbrandia_rubra.ctg7224:2456-4888(+)